MIKTLSLLLKLLVSLNFMLILSSCGEKPSIKGKVLNQLGEPIANIEVIVEDSVHKATTDKQGLFTLPWLEGKVVIAAKPTKNYLSVSESKIEKLLSKERYPHGISVNLLIFDILKAPIVGQVEDQNGKPIVGASVFVNSSVFVNLRQKSITKETKTDKDGKYQLPFMQGIVRISAVAPKDKNYIVITPKSSKYIIIVKTKYPKGVEVNLTLYDYTDDFIVSSDTIIDKRTALMWQRHDKPYISWSKAQKYSDSLRLGGFSDWRLPKSSEFLSLYESLSKPAGGQKNRMVKPFYWSGKVSWASPGHYWTSEKFSEKHSAFTYAKYFDMPKGTIKESDIVQSINYRHVRAVRSISKSK